MRKTDIAWSRFGLGPRPGDEPLTDPIGWLRDQMDDYRPDLASTGALASRARIIADAAGPIVVPIRRKPD